MGRRQKGKHHKRKKSWHRRDTDRKQRAFERALEQATKDARRPAAGPEHEAHHG